MEMPLSGDRGECAISPMNTIPIKRVNAVVEGRVQGVGFRYFTRDRALRHGITGWVRNLPEDNVEIEAQGTGDNVDAFIMEIKKGPGSFACV